MRIRFICGVAIGFAVGVLMAGAAIVPQSGDQSPTVAELVTRLKDADFTIRQKALGYIGSMKPNPNEMAPHVVRLLQDSNYLVRAAAARALGNLQNALPDLGTRFPECIPQLIPMLSDRDPGDKYQLVRRDAAYAMQHIGASAKPAVPELLKIAANKDDDPSVRLWTVQALGSIGFASSEVVSTLVSLLDEPSKVRNGQLTIAGAAHSSLARFKANAEVERVFMQRLQRTDESERARAASSLGTPGFGSAEAEKALLKLLDDNSTKVQRAALFSLEKINETYAFFFHNNISSSAVYEKQQALMREIRADPSRRTAFAKISAAQIRFGAGQFGETFHPRRVNALHKLVELDAREHLPMLKELFGNLEKKTLYLEPRDLRLQLLITLAAWLPEKEAVSFLINVDSDADEDPRVRFRSVTLLCERSDTQSHSYIATQHSEKATKHTPLVTINDLQKSLKDRRHFLSDAEFAELTVVGLDELARIERGIQLAQHLYSLQKRGAIQKLSVAKVQVRERKIESIHFALSVPSEWWGFDLRKKGDVWLPAAFQMQYIE